MRGIYNLMYFSNFWKKIIMWESPFVEISGILYFPGNSWLENLCSKSICPKANYERLFSEKFVSNHHTMRNFYVIKNYWDIYVSIPCRSLFDLSSEIRNFWPLNQSSQNWQSNSHSNTGHNNLHLDHKF